MLRPSAFPPPKWLVSKPWVKEPSSRATWVSLSLPMWMKVRPANGRK
jgi:hypothetical protein